MTGWQDHTNASVDPCMPTRWTGLSCLASPDRVTAIALPNRGVRGQLPDVFTDFTALTSVDLSSNQLIGSVPGSLAVLPSLRSLTLSTNALVRVFALSRVVVERRKPQLSFVPTPSPPPPSAAFKGPLRFPPTYPSRVSCLLLR
jgi:hypothetical protein